MKRVPTLSDLRRAQPLRIEDGAAPARRRAALVDEVLAGLTEEILGPQPAVAVAAVGGYGRGELWPHSDIDLLFVSARRDLTPATLRGVLYPLWDAGYQVGHALRAPKEAIAHSEGDLDAATALLHARFVGGTRAAFDELLDRRAAWLRKSGRVVVRRILEATAERHARRDRAGWSLAPDLKDDVGGLRDMHTLLWLEAATGLEFSLPRLDAAAELLSAVREALHGETARKSDVLRIDLQPVVARRLDVELDDLMTQVHSAARDVEHLGARVREQIVAQILGGPRRSGDSRPVREGVAVEDGQLVAHPGTAPLEILAAYAETGKRPSPLTLETLQGAFDGPPLEQWDPATTKAFLDLLRGPNAPSALELLDHERGFARLLPEWDAIRGRAQHDPYHRYTVDGHTFLVIGGVGAVIQHDPLAAAGRREGDDLDTVYLGALFHDIGKGSGDDHSVVGERITRRACARMGLPSDTTDDACALVRWHLLLPDTATRRDLDDGAVIDSVARAAGTPRRLWMLYVLAVADGRATGPRAWNDWKAALVRELYGKAREALETGSLPARRDVTAVAAAVEAYEPGFAGRAATLLDEMPPSYLDSVPVPDLAEELRLLSSRPGPGEVRHRVETDGARALVTICVADRPGALARSAGVLALTRMSVLSAQAYSSEDGIALQRFVVEPPENPRWERFEATLAAAYSGRLALENDVERKVADYRPAESVHPEVRVLRDASEHSTVVEVRARDALGLLYATTVALGDLGLDIHVAKIDTLGERVVDVFYVRSPSGEKLDEAQSGAVERAVVHRIERLLENRARP